MGPEGSEDLFNSKQDFYHQMHGFLSNLRIPTCKTATKPQKCEKNSGTQTEVKNLIIIEGIPAMPPTEREKSYSISEAADILCISIPTLRMYEREGLVIPSRRSSGHRAYTETELERIRCYRQAMTRDKITIAHLKRLLSLIPCWEINECPDSARETCKAYPSRVAPCWSSTEKSWQSQCGQCHECQVYLRSQDPSELVQLIAEHANAGEKG